MANEKRPIDANRLKMRMIAFATAIKREYLSIEEIVDTINSEDTVDAVEVVHGRWKKIPYHPYRCSECNEIAPLDQSGEFHYTSNYCPNCGADMRERRTDD